MGRILETPGSGIFSPGFTLGSPGELFKRIGCFLERVSGSEVKG